MSRGAWRREPLWPLVGQWRRRGRGYPVGLMVSRSAPVAPTALRCSWSGAAAVASQPAAFAPVCINPPRSVLGCAEDFPRSTALLGAAQIAPPGTPCRECDRGGCSLKVLRGWPQRGEGAGGGAHVERRVAQRVRPRAQRASPSLWARLFERTNAVSCGELSARPHPRATQGSRRVAPTAEPKRYRLPPHRAAAPALCKRAYSARYTLTYSTSICTGNTASSTGPPRCPPTAMLRIRNSGVSNGHCALPLPSFR
jgi:hypothetical protein